MGSTTDRASRWQTYLPASAVLNTSPVESDPGTHLPVTGSRLTANIGLMTETGVLVLGRNWRIKFEAAVSLCAGDTVTPVHDTEVCPEG